MVETGEQETTTHAHILTPRPLPRDVINIQSFHAQHNALTRQRKASHPVILPPRLRLWSGNSRISRSLPTYLGVPTCQAKARERALTKKMKVKEKVKGKAKDCQIVFSTDKRRRAFSRTAFYLPWRDSWRWQSISPLFSFMLLLRRRLRCHILIVTAVFRPSCLPMC